MNAIQSNEHNKKINMLREKIDEGLAQSQFGTVILSHNFFL